MTQQQRTEVRLVERARSGDRRAQQTLWEDHRRWVAAIVLVHRPRSIEVDDLMQEVAVVFVSKLTMLRDPAAFRPWLRRVVINICRASARSMRPMSALPDETIGGYAGVADRHADSAEDVASHDAADRVLRQAMGLPPEYREPLLLRCLRSLSYEQIGAILELPVTTVETRLARARRMMRQEIGEEIRPGGAP